MAVHNTLTELSNDVARWEMGSIRVPADDRGKFLVNLYRQATTSVFSTSLKAFSGTFRQSSLPDDILDANCKAGVPTTRVFVYDHADDVNAFDFREMNRQKKAGIEVRVILRSVAILPPIDDFTIIDDSAIGITEFIGPHDAAARWTFEDNATLRPFRELRQQLLEQSVVLDEFVAKANARSNIWRSHALVDVSDYNIDSYQQLSRKFFGGDGADNACVLTVQRKAGSGIYVLQRRMNDSVRTVGIFALVPVSRQGFRRLEADTLKGAAFTTDDVLGAGERNPIAFYLGAIGGIDLKAQGALLDFLRSSIRELAQTGVESLFARPVTEDGLTLVRSFKFDGPPGQKLPAMNHVCRLRLGQN